MILNNAPQAEAVMSNVGEIGEFRIRNSAKAFNILSSGLYANKIRAIIRELSCNAVDSHVAAGRGTNKTNAPFLVHLPTTLEPYFFIRDFGTGLNHEQVTNIYTTYFESTKTDSNAFIGALGLGSKSPFSYTDNFTVTAIKDGRKGIYTAFINDAGVPSIAMMGEEDTTEPSGVEVRFAVESQNDMHKFADEAQNVYRWFKQQPEFVGKELAINEVKYAVKDIIPGVHQRDLSGYNTYSFAVMGNIAYPIEIPNAKNDLAGLHKLLDCGLVMEFGIGELDFQASREGLSYIPLTINSIKSKLEQLNVALIDVLKTEADAIDNLWTRSQFLYARKKSPLWTSAVSGYVTATKFPLFDHGQWNSCYEFVVKQSELALMNIRVNGFSVLRNQKACPTRKTTDVDSGKKNDLGYVIHETAHKFDVETNVFFVTNDTKVGAVERAKQHFRQNESKSYQRDVYVLDKIDRNKEMDLKSFFALIHQPPEEQCLFVSNLDEKPRKTTGGNGLGKNISILKLVERGGNSWQQRSRDLVWRDAGKLEDFDDKKTHYYVELSGFVPKWEKLFGNIGVHDLVVTCNNTKLSELSVQVYGVRKNDMEVIKNKSNWKKLESHVIDTMNTLVNKVNTAVAMEQFASCKIFEYNSAKLLKGIENTNSDAKDFLKEFEGLPKIDGIHHVRTLMRYLGMTTESEIAIKTLIVKYKGKIVNFMNTYPLIDKFGHYAKEEDVAAYINLVDKVKGL